MKTIIRGFVNGTIRFEDHVEIEPDELDTAIPALAAKHVLAVGDEPHMIEFEFPDEPDPLQRFFRFGTDPSGMVIPCVWR
jgi:hypothetical protein